MDQRPGSFSPRADSVTSWAMRLRRVASVLVSLSPRRTTPLELSLMAKQQPHPRPHRGLNQTKKARH